MSQKNEPKAPKRSAMLTAHVVSEFNRQKLFDKTGLHAWGHSPWGNQPWGNSPDWGNGVPWGHSPWGNQDWGNSPEWVNSAPRSAGRSIGMKKPLSAFRIA